MIVKPVNSTSQAFRTTREGVVASLVGGSEEFPEDVGFIVGKTWEAVRFENAGISVEGTQALAMGQNFFKGLENLRNNFLKSSISSINNNFLYLFMCIFYIFYMY